MMYPWGDERHYNSYSGYFRRIFGSRVQKLSVNVGFTCPNRDGTVGFGGCTFCRNDAFTPSYCSSTKSVQQQLQEGIEFHRNRYRSAERYIAYFQSFSNTYASLDVLKQLYASVFDNPEVIGVIVGTRPDCMDEEKLDFFAELSRLLFVCFVFGFAKSNVFTLSPSTSNSLIFDKSSFMVKDKSFRKYFSDLLCLYGTAFPSAVFANSGCDSISNFLSINGRSPRIKISALELSKRRTSSSVKSSRPAFW